MKAIGHQLNWKKRLGIAAVNGGIFMLLFGLVHYISQGGIHDWEVLVFQAFFFGLFMALVFPLIFRKMAELEPGEIIETEGAANLFRGVEAVGGKLFLTNERVVFKSHKLNINTGQFDISYDLISEVSPRKTGKLVDNGLRLTLVDGREFDFVISSSETWVKKIEEKLSKSG